MEFFEFRAASGPSLIGLKSQSTDCQGIVLHVHGYGGDHYSNPFVREMHRYLPQVGVAFCSIPLRTSHYLWEAYSDTSVQYLGSSVVSQDEALEDVMAAAHALRSIGLPIILQGHSFGTNVVKKVIEQQSQEFVGAAFLSPADSWALYQDWLAGAPDEVQANDPDEIRWDLFGISTPSSRYPLPITAGVAANLFTSAIFHAWSTDAPHLNPGGHLAVKGTTDPISAVGTTGSNEYLKRKIGGGSVLEIEDAGHTFRGQETALTAAVAEWAAEAFRCCS
jgi:hypothetical protein